MAERQKIFLKYERINTAFGIVIGALSLAPILLIMVFWMSAVENSVQWGKQNTNTIVTILTLLSVVFVAVTVVYFSYYRIVIKEKGYNNPSLEPCLYYSRIMQYTDIVKQFSNSIDGEFKTLSSASDSYASYGFFDGQGIYYRLLVIDIKDFTRENRKKYMSRFNRQINKRENVDQWGPMSKLKKQVRVNLFVIPAYNDYAYEIMQVNASESMRRVEAILNVVYCKQDGRLFIPTHFGSWYEEKYCKIHELILFCLKPTHTDSKSI